MIGKDNFGEFVKSSLEARGVDSSLLIETERSATGATIILNNNEDRAMVTYQGSMDLMSFKDIDKSVFETTKHIHLSSIFLQSGIKKDLAEILSYAHKKGVTTSLDPQWDPLEKWDFDYKTLLPLVSVFMPNEKEVQFLTGSSTLEEALEKIRPYIHICVVKRGNKGSLMMFSDGSTCNLNAFLNEEVVDAIGAGDSFNAGFINYFVQEKTPYECQHLGNLTGAINTTAAGGTGAFTSKVDIIKTAKEIFNQEITL